MEGVGEAREKEEGESVSKKERGADAMVELFFELVTEVDKEENYYTVGDYTEFEEEGNVFVLDDFFRGAELGGEFFVEAGAGGAGASAEDE